MIHSRKLIAALGIAALLGGAAFAEEKSSHEANERPIQLAEVPAAARTAGEQALGGKISEAKVFDQGGQQVYELEGRGPAGEKKEVHMSADGKVLSYEGDGDDDDD